MPTIPSRAMHAALTAAILIACADAKSPTQPVRESSEPGPSPRPVANVGTAETGMPSVIYACFVPGKGDIYRIKTSGTPDQCSKKHIEFSWQDKGEPGPAGPAGPEGPQGMQGPPGPAGPLSGLTQYAKTVTLPEDGLFRATCPDGQSALGLGYSIPVNEPLSNTGTIGAIRPAANGPNQIIWVFRAAPGTTWVFYWTCANAEPPQFVSLPSE